MSEYLSQKELILLQNLEEHQSQRSLAHASAFSLGMTNILLKRLVRKGFVKVTTLNGRTLRYILTPIGFAEKVRRSYDFLVVSIRQLNEAKRKIKNAILSESTAESIWLIGKNELADLALEILGDIPIQVRFLPDSKPQNGWDIVVQGSILLICDPDRTCPPELMEKVKLIDLPGLMS